MRAPSRWRGWSVARGWSPRRPISDVLWTAGWLVLLLLALPLAMIETYRLALAVGVLGTLMMAVSVVVGVSRCRPQDDELLSGRDDH